MPCKYVVGVGAILDRTVAAWREIAPETNIERIELAQDASYGFNLDLLDRLAGFAKQTGVTAFAACDSQFLNFRRFELMGELKSRGFSMPGLICRGAIVADTAVIGENAVVGAGAIVAHGCVVGFNAVVGAGANLGSDSRIGSSAWIEAGVLVGRGAKIGVNATLGYGVIVGDATEVGKLSIVDRPGAISKNLAARTFLHASFDRPIVIVEN